MNRFYIIPCVVDGKGKIRVLQTEHNGHTRSLYEDKADARKLRYLEDAFGRAARELEHIERRELEIKDARELNEEVEAWKRAANEA